VLSSFDWVFRLGLLVGGRLEEALGKQDMARRSQSISFWLPVKMLDQYRRGSNAWRRHCSDRIANTKSRRWQIRNRRSSTHSPCQDIELHWSISAAKAVLDWLPG
jgi:hypothetical protein